MSRSSSNARLSGVRPRPESLISHSQPSLPRLCRPLAERRGYTSVVNALMRISREEGVRALWSGTPPTIARACLLNAGQLAVCVFALAHTCHPLDPQSTAHLQLERGHVFELCNFYILVHRYSEAKELVHSRTGQSRAPPCIVALLRRAHCNLIINHSPCLPVRCQRGKRGVTPVGRIQNSCSRRCRGCRAAVRLQSHQRRGGSRHAPSRTPHGAPWQLLNSTDTDGTPRHHDTQCNVNTCHT